MTQPNAELVERLRSAEPLPVCPYDRRSPDYLTTDNDAACTQAEICTRIYLAMRAALSKEQGNG
jgi:hypothetical protein